MCSSQRRESAIGSWEFKGYNILLLLYKHIYMDILLVLIRKKCNLVIKPQNWLFNAEYEFKQLQPNKISKFY